jgi:hypothetical protein
LSLLLFLNARPFQGRKLCTTFALSKIKVEVLIMGKHIILGVFLSILSGVAYAQKSVSIRLTDPNAETVQGAMVTLISGNDKTRSWKKVTDSAGKVNVSVAPGRYRMKIEAYSFAKWEKDWTISGDLDTLISLVRDAKLMKGVVVTARKPLMRQEDDKTIVDPEPVALGSTHAFEVLEKIPGLFIDQDGNVYLNSTSPSAVWINGREQRMSNADIATLLKSLPPGAIDRVELVRTPSARYDASGVGGIVNIILKKNVRIGLFSEFTKIVTRISKILYGMVSSDLIFSPSICRPQINSLKMVIAVNSKSKANESSGFFEWRVFHDLTHHLHFNDTVPDICIQ